MKQGKFRSVWRLLYVGCFIFVQYAAAADWMTVFNTAAIVITGSIALMYPPMVAKAGWDWATSRGTADAKEIPWQRLLVSGVWMLSPAGIVATFNLA